MIYSTTGILDKTTNIISVTSIDYLFVGLFIYGVGIIPCSKILSIDSIHLTITIANNPEVNSVSTTLYFTDLQPNKYQDLCEAKKELLSLMQQHGGLLEFVIRDEIDITRDRYNSIQRKTQTPIVRIHAFPIEFNPSPKILEKAGIRQTVDVLIHTSKYEWELAGYYRIEDIDEIRTSIKINNVVYEVKQSNYFSQMGSDFLYIVFGLVQK